ncbi:MAG: LytTR family DNA-binding domain-containing protein [Bacteroidota bacterium]
MQHIPTIVVEDEAGGMENILMKIERNCPELYVVATCSTGEDAIKQIAAHRPQLVFLDINLGSMTGFDVLKKLQQVSFQVVFTTAYGEYGIEAVKAKAVDYILKPIRPAELRKATDLALQRIHEQKPPERLFVPHGNGQRVFRISEITYCLADNVNTVIYTEDGNKFLAVKTLKSIDAMLPKHKFHRVSRSAVVNIDFVESWHKADGGYIIMRDGQNIPTVKTRVEEFLKKLSGTA